MANVEIKWGVIGLGIMKVRFGSDLEYTDTYPVFKSQPENVVRFGPVYEADGDRVATGQRIVESRERNVAWLVDEAQAAEIADRFREAIEENNRQVFFADED